MLSEINGELRLSKYSTVMVCTKDCTYIGKSADHPRILSAMVPWENPRIFSAYSLGACHLSGISDGWFLINIISLYL